MLGKADSENATMARMDERLSMDPTLSETSPCLDFKNRMYASETLLLLLPFCAPAFQLSLHPRIRGADRNGLRDLPRRIAR